MNFCENIKCKKEHSGEYGSGRFCCRSCSNSHVPSKEHREKTSTTLTGKKSAIKDTEKWKAALVTAHQHKKLKRDNEILIIPFINLSQTEKKYRVLHEQNYVCMHCNIPQEWNNKPLKFDLDHISGDRNDNSRENLRCLCPNCHSQTPTYKSKNNIRDKISDAEFCNALSKNDSIYKALVELQVNLGGGNYRRARRLIQQYGLEIKL